MVFQGNSQNISKGDRVLVYRNQVGDTMISMRLKDAKTLLEDVLHCEYADSLLTKYKEKDSLQRIQLDLNSEIIDNLKLKNHNLDTINSNLEEILKNKDSEIVYKNDIIKQQKKELRSQKIQTVIGFIGSITLPIITLLLLI
jgi:gamma-glutamyl phosphate reductase